MKLDLNKILEYFNNLNDKARYGILGGVVFIIILIDVFLLFLPQLNSITSINDQITKMTADTEQVLTDRQRIGQLRKNLEANRLELKELSGKVRPIQEVPAILETISSIANEYGIKLDELVPEKDKQEALSSPKDLTKYYALPVVIKARGGYHMFGHFLNKMENDDLYFIMKDFIIQNDAKNPNTHSFSLTIKLILVSTNGG